MTLLLTRDMVCQCYVTGQFLYSRSYAETGDKDILANAMPQAICYEDQQADSYVVMPEWALVGDQFIIAVDISSCYGYDGGVRLPPLILPPASFPPLWEEESFANTSFFRSTREPFITDVYGAPLPLLTVSTAAGKTYLPAK